MNPNKMLAEAKAQPEKQGLEAYSATIWELRRKGKTYREIAEFLNERGVSTDHTAVYRICIAKGNPLMSSPEGAILHGDVVYESRQGRPLRPFEAGLFILIKDAPEIIPLKDAAPGGAIWCEAHFELNAAPNHDWLRQLCEELDLRWNSATPYHLQGRFGFELKVDGTLMAMVCPTYNLEDCMKKVGTAVHETTKYFRQNKVRPYDLREMLASRDAEIMASLVPAPGLSREEEIEEALEWNLKNAKQLTRRFDEIAAPYVAK
jgi:hypothetical protein